VIATIEKSWAGLASLLFLFLQIAQFIAYFNFSNIAEVVAVKLGDVLERMNIGAVWLLIRLIIVTFIVDLIIPAAITIITFLVLAAVGVLFVAHVVPVAIVAVGTALSLWATGVCPPPGASPRCSGCSATGTCERRGRGRV